MSGSRGSSCTGPYVATARGTRSSAIRGTPVTRDTQGRGQGEGGRAGSRIEGGHALILPPLRTNHHPHNWGIALVHVAWYRPTGVRGGAAGGCSRRLIVVERSRIVGVTGRFEGCVPFVRIFRVDRFSIFFFIIFLLCMARELCLFPWSWCVPLVGLRHERRRKYDVCAEGWR